MDDVGLRELMRLGVQRATAGVSLSEVGPEDAIWSVVDKLTLLGGLLLEHGRFEIWTELTQSLMQILRALAQEKDAGRLTEQRTNNLFQFSWRLYALGAYAVSLGRFNALHDLTFIAPRNDSPNQFWSRYITTAVARESLDSWKKSLIPPAADWIRANREFTIWFGNEQDKIVNTLCQYDFWQCAAILARTKNSFDIYPNFGIYWNHRTEPIVADMARGGNAATSLDVSEPALAEIIRGLDELAGKVFFHFNGWDTNSWHDAAIKALLHNNNTPALRIRN